MAPCDSRLLMSGHFVPLTAVALGFINFYRFERWEERESVIVEATVPPRRHNTIDRECLIITYFFFPAPDPHSFQRTVCFGLCLSLCVLGHSDHPLPIYWPCNYFRILRQGRTMIDDDHPLFSNDGPRWDTGPPWGQIEEMICFLEDTDTIRSPQVSRLPAVYLTFLFSLSLYFFFFAFSPCFCLALATKQVSKCRGIISRPCWVWLCCVEQEPAGVSLCEAMYEEICSVIYKYRTWKLVIFRFYTCKLFWMYLNLALLETLISHLNNMQSLTLLLTCWKSEVSILWLLSYVCHFSLSVSFLLALAQLESFYWEAAAVNCKCLH